MRPNGCRMSTTPATVGDPETEPPGNRKPVRRSSVVGWFGVARILIPRQNRGSLVALRANPPRITAPRWFPLRSGLAIARPRALRLYGITAIRAIRPPSPEFRIWDFGFSANQPENLTGTRCGGRFLFRCSRSGGDKPLPYGSELIATTGCLGYLLAAVNLTPLGFCFVGEGFIPSRAKASQPVDGHREGFPPTLQRRFDHGGRRGIPNSEFRIRQRANLFQYAVKRFKLPASGIEVGRKSHAALSHRYHDPPFEKPASGVGRADARVAGGDNACDRVSRAR